MALQWVASRLGIGTVPEPSPAPEPDGGVNSAIDQPAPKRVRSERATEPQVCFSPKWTHSSAVLFGRVHTLHDSVDRHGSSPRYVPTQTTPLFAAGYDQ